MSQLALGAKNILDVMAKFVRDHISLCKFTRRAEAALKLVIKSQIDINLFIVWAIKGAGGGFRSPATRLDGIAEKNQFGMVIRSASLLRKKVRPRFLRVVQNERDKLHERLLRGVPRGIRPGGGRLRSDGAASAEQSKEVCLEDEAENQQKDGAADADVHAAESKTASATAGIVAPILDILALTAWRPSHDLLLFRAAPQNVSTMFVPCA